MKPELQEKRCIKCGKLLIDEKWIFCRRCSLLARNEATTAGGIGTVLAMIVYSVTNHIDSTPPDSTV